jgi:hypothetical protein
MLSKQLIDKKPETLESLLRFLIYIVLHQEKAATPGKGEPATINESTKKTLLELLRSDDKLQETIFGATQKPQMDEIHLNKEDLLQSMTKGIQLRAKQTNEELLLDVEEKDMLRANRVAFKFISFKTPASMPPMSTSSHAKMTLPNSFFFTFKFYTF